MSTPRKFQFRARTIDDNVVRDGLEATSILYDQEQFFLVGGIATQSYLPTSCRRPTADIDFAICRPLGKPDFRGMIRPVADELEAKGYETEIKTRNRSRSYALDYSNGEGATSIEFVRMNENNYQRNKNIFEREYKNSRKKILEGRETSYRVVSPEDIVAPKLMRMVNSIDRNPELFRLLPKHLIPLSDIQIKNYLENINEVRDEAVSNPGDSYLANKLRFVSDLYDMRILAEVTGLNESYLKESFEGWDSLKNKPDLVKRVCDSVLLV